MLISPDDDPAPEAVRRACPCRIKPLRCDNDNAAQSTLTLPKSPPFAIIHDRSRIIATEKGWSLLDQGRFSCD
jgi:hypothetical protein